MKPLTITITTELAEQICRVLETLELDHNDTVAGILGCEIRGLIAPDVEAPEPPPDPEDAGPEEPAPEQAEVEFPEPAPVEREVEFPEPAPYEREVEEDDDEQSDDYDEPPDP